MRENYELKNFAHIQSQKVIISVKNKMNLCTNIEESIAIIQSIKNFKLEELHYGSETEAKI